MVRYLGFDGSRRGWVAAWIEDNGNQGFDYSPTIDRLLKISHARAMIDIPIGLPNDGVRECDKSDTMKKARGWRSAASKFQFINL